VVGGLKVNEPAMDLAIGLSIASSFTDREVDPNMVVVGEVGLSGEVRGVPQLDRRLGDAVRQGFTRCLVPRSSLAAIVPPKEMEVLAADSLKEALKLGLKSAPASPS
jgi:DNA repair protein RadA/Sms